MLSLWSGTPEGRPNFTTIVSTLYEHLECMSDYLELRKSLSNSAGPAPLLDNEVACHMEQLTIEEPQQHSSAAKVNHYILDPTSNYAIAD